MPAAVPEPPLAPGLYIVATPIGNLEDLSPRAARILRAAAVVAAEDTRVTRTLLAHAGSTRPMIRMDEHATAGMRSALLDRAAAEPVALVSDAGTPLISDPGLPLVREARARGLLVTTAPGPCAAIAALSVAGLPTDRFFFAGFLPPRAAARDAAIAALVAIPGTLVFHESGARLGRTLEALARILGPREAAIARELTKRFEEVRTGPLDTLAAEAASHPPPRGEIVLLVGPPTAAGAGASEDLDSALRGALARMPPGKAAASVAQAFGLPRGPLYARALALSKP